MNPTDREKLEFVYEMERARSNAGIVGVAGAIVLLFCAWMGWC